MKGNGEQLDYGMRIYDDRISRFLSVDPITAQYPQLTPYQFASNRPIDGVDLDGREYKNKSVYSTYVTNATVIKMVGNIPVPTEGTVMKVGYNYNNAPDYFKEHGMHLKQHLLQETTDMTAVRRPALIILLRRVWREIMHQLMNGSRAVYAMVTA